MARRVCAVLHFRADGNVRLKALLDYFHNALVTDLKPQMQVADKAGPRVLMVCIALTDLTPTNVGDSLVGTAVPYGFVGRNRERRGDRTAVGSDAVLGETGIEEQFRDGASGAIIVEREDTEVGRKHAAELNASVSGATDAWISGYLSFLAVGRTRRMRLTNGLP